MVFGLSRKKISKKVKGSKKKVARRKTVSKAKRPKRKGVRGKRRRGVVTKKVEQKVLELELIGEVSHYFPHVKAGVIKVLKSEVNIGDQLYIKGHTTDFKQKVNSMQIDRVPIKRAKKGDEIGLLVKRRVRIGDSVYKV